MNEAVIFLLIKGNEYLAEKRKLTKKILPGKTVIPGGRIEPGETPEQALHREVKEELGINITKYDYICTLLNKVTGTIGKSHFYAITEWEGNIQAQEAESLTWLSLDEEEKIETTIGLVAIKEYKRIYKQ